jgi:hypothetical protein
MSSRLVAGIALLGGALVFVTTARADPPIAPEPARVQALLKQLDDPRFLARQEADRGLRKLGIGVAPQLRKELKTRPPLEVVRRIDDIIDHFLSIPWVDDWDEAIQEAKKISKPMLVLSTLGKRGGASSLASQAMLARTFADLELVDFLKKNFVMVWHDHLPSSMNSLFFTDGFPDFSPPSFTKEQIDEYTEGRGADVLHTYFCTAEGKVIYALRGFWHKQRMLAEARFARKLAEETPALPATLRTDLIRATLAQRSDELARDRQGFGPEDARWADTLEQSLTTSSGVLDRPLPPILEELGKKVLSHAYG